MTDTANGSATTIADEWFYTHGGQRMGPVPAAKLQELLAAQTIGDETPIWRKGLADWKPLRDTEFGAHVKDEPPPIAPSLVNNTLVWTLALAPIAYLFLDAAILDYQIANPYQDNSIVAALSWVIPIAANAALCLLDERQLKRAGYDSASLTFFALLLAPVYLFVRAKRLRQTPTYGFAWIASFVVSILLRAA